LGHVVAVDPRRLDADATLLGQGPVLLVPVVVPATGSGEHLVQQQPTRSPSASHVGPPWDFVRARSPMYAIALYAIALYAA
jgi:hypothetical protein